MGNSPVFSNVFLKLKLSGIKVNQIEIKLRKNIPSAFTPPTSMTEGLSADDDRSLVTLPPPEDLLLLLLLPPRWSMEFFLWQSMQKSRNLEMASRGMNAYWSAT